MPTYEYRCESCKHTFSLVQTIAEHDKGKVACPKCSKKDVKQLVSAFLTQTSKKS